MDNSNLPPWPRQPALFLDLDGTLLEFAEHPLDVVPSALLRTVLPQLISATGGAVALVSGRPIAELDRLLAPHRFAAAGIHGLERRKQFDAEVESRGDGAPLAGIRASIEAFIGDQPGLLLEDKQSAIALHYRQRPDLEGAIERFVAEISIALPATLDLLRGKQVIEIKLGGTNKGDAIRAFMQDLPFRDGTPVFLGDDVTDEAGFAAVNALAGISVKVGPGKTVARWRLKDVDSVLAWLADAVADPAKPISRIGANIE